jgi:hypothetical protein
MTTSPDIFSNVHKGIRNALFQACVALGRAGADEQRQIFARGQLRNALHFVAHHGENEDLLLLAMLEGRAPRVFARMRQAHDALESTLRMLSTQLEEGAIESLYQNACGFTSLYLEHMREEECELEPLIRAQVPAAELATFAVQAAARTHPRDVLLMMGWMLPAMTHDAVQAALAKMPAELTAKLLPIADR